MNRIYLPAIALVFLTLAMTCQHKKDHISVIEVVEEVSNDTISFYNTDRNDVPLPPRSPWWTLDTTNLDVCQQRIWNYMKTMYPINDENYWNYDIYSIMGEPEELAANMAMSNRYTYFFIDTIFAGMMQQEPYLCSTIDSTFFLQGLGPPTCRSHNVGLEEITYFYNFKLRYRRGPCPYIFDQGNQWEWRCYQEHLKYCALLMVKFKEGTGRMRYISFYGSGT